MKPATITLLLGDVRDRLGDIDTGSVGLIVTSPPFLALRSYLPADHPDKHREIGSEPTPAAFIDTMLGLSADWRRVLAPWGSLAVELGDTYSGAGGYGSPDSFNPAYGQPRFEERWEGRTRKRYKVKDDGWPLAKSLAGIPTLYTWSLAYGRNLLTGDPSPAGQWRIRNLLVWARPNPPVGALGDKWRPATSYVTVACVSDRRWFDLDAVRSGITDLTADAKNIGRVDGRELARAAVGLSSGNGWTGINPAGAPPLDWHDDRDWQPLVGMPTAPYSGKALVKRRVRVQADDALGDDVERTTSPDCPVHGDQVAPLPTARRGEREGTSTPHTSRTGARRAEGQRADCAPTVQHPVPTSEASSSDSSGRPCAPAATSRSTASSKTDRAPVTTIPGSASEGTTARTGGTPAPPSSGGQHHDTPASSTSADESSGSQTSGTSHRTVDSGTVQRSSEACTCSYFRVVGEEYTSHYAVYPPALPRKLIRSMCPEWVCGLCGEPRRRVVDHCRTFDKVTSTAGRQEKVAGAGPMGSVYEVSRTTLGWTDCGHDAYIPGVVLDPFAGSGTTLAVAAEQGRDAIGIELNADNVELIDRRIGDHVHVLERVDHPDRIVWTVTAVTSEPKRQIDGQMSLMESL